MAARKPRSYLLLALGLALVGALALLAFFAAPTRSNAQDLSVSPTPPGIDPAALRRALGLEAGLPMPAEKTPAPGEAGAAAPPAAPLPTPEDEHATYLAEQRQRIELEKQALEALQAEIKAEVARLEAVRAEIDQRLAQEDEETRKKLQNLIKIYEGMRPTDLVRVLSGLEENLRLQIMLRMKPKIVSQILSLMDPQQAAKISEKLLSKRVR